MNAVDPAEPHDGSACRLILVRHCQAADQDCDAPLTEIGLRQAGELADFLSGLPIDFIVASAFRRARQSAEPLAERLGLSVSIESRLNERRLSPHPIPDWRAVVRGSFDNPDLRAPGGESAREVLDRSWAGLNDLLSQRYQLPLAVTHGNLLALVLHSIDPGFGYAGWESLSNPDVYCVRVGGDGVMSFRRLWDPPTMR